MNAIIFDAISWIGLSFCIGAFFIKDIKKLRLITVLGCMLMGVYYLHIGVAQGMVSNAVIIMINTVYLIKMQQQNQQQQNQDNFELTDDIEIEMAS